MTTLSPVLMDPLVLDADPEVVVARVVQRLTVYTDKPVDYAMGQAAELLRVYLRLLGPRERYWFTTSRRDQWLRISGGAAPEIVDQLCNPGLRRPRHQFLFRLVDRTDTPIEEFSYREVDSARFGHAGVLSFTLRPEADPSDLLQLALEVGNTAPFVSGIGGYAVAINERIRPEGYTYARRLARRFLGLDVQNGEAMGRVAYRGLPGTNWLTLIGRPLAGAFPELESIRDHAFVEPDVVVMALRQGLLIRAGDRPTPGDVNELETPRAYHEVAAALSPFFAPEVEEYPGAFGREEVTAAYLRRLAEPEPWLRR